MGLFYLFLIIIPAGLILTGFAAYFISRAAFKPIAQMSDTAKNISGENLDKRLELPKAKDEVRALGVTLNEMIERIESVTIEEIADIAQHIFDGNDRCRTKRKPAVRVGK